MGVFIQTVGQYRNCNESEGVSGVYAEMNFCDLALSYGYGNVVAGLNRRCASQ